MAKNAFNKRREPLSKRTSKDLKKKVIKNIVWSVKLYGLKTWILRKYERETDWEILKCVHGAIWKISAERITRPTNMC